jgi:hypothetical protein
MNSIAISNVSFQRIAQGRDLLVAIAACFDETRSEVRNYWVIGEKSLEFGTALSKNKSRTIGVEAEQEFTELTTLFQLCPEPIEVIQGMRSWIKQI